MYLVVGHCPKCGAPVYAPTTYGSVCPPPSQPSCSCSMLSYAPNQERGHYTFTPNPLSADDIRKIVREEIERAGMGKPADEVKP